MGLETGTFIDDLVPTNPLGTDPKSQGDDHVRLIKQILQGQFTGLGQEAVTVPASDLNGGMFDNRLAGYVDTGFMNQYDGDLNEILQNSKYRIQNATAINQPADFTNSGFLETLVTDATTDGVQILTGAGTNSQGKIWFRRLSTTWQPWVSLESPNQSPFVAYGRVSSIGGLSADNGLFTATDGGSGVLNISFNNTQPDADYHVQLTTTAGGFRVALVSNAVPIDENGFQINVYTDTGALNNATVFVMITRTDVPFA